jgi:hypothetical protein
MKRTRTWTLRGFQTVTTGAVVTVWAVFWLIAILKADPLPTPDTAIAFLVLPPLLWTVAARLVLRRWWYATGSRMSELDPPGRLLALAVAALPEARRDWGRAMTAELAGVEGRSARWGFALSSVRATLWLPPAGGWPVLALVTVAAVAATAAAGRLVGAAVHGLGTFAVAFTAMVGTMAVLAVARSRRPRLPTPAATVVVTGGVAAAIAVTVVFLLRDSAEAEHLPPGAASYLAADESLPPGAALYLAAVLVGCLWIALAAPRWLGASRLAPRLGVAAAVVFTSWFLLAIRTDEGAEPSLPLLILLALVLPLAPLAAILAPAFTAARVTGSFRAGLKAAVWTAAATTPFAYALWLLEALRRYGIDGTRLVGESGTPEPLGTNLTDALVFTLGIFPALALTVAVIAAALGARTARRVQ